MTNILTGYLQNQLMDTYTETLFGGDLQDLGDFDLIVKVTSP